MPRQVHPDDDRVYACPECDNVPVYERTGTNIHSGYKGGTYACYDCGGVFDDPVERERHNGGTKTALERGADRSNAAHAKTETDGQRQQQRTVTCPVCGEGFQNLPKHFPCDGGSDD